MTDIKKYVTYSYDGDDGNKITRDNMRFMISKIKFALSQFNSIHKESDMERIESEILEYISESYHNVEHTDEHILDIYRIFGDLFSEDNPNKKIIEFNNDKTIINHNNKVSDKHNDELIKYEVSTEISEVPDYKQQKNLSEIIEHISQIENYYLDYDAVNYRILRARRSEDILADKLIISKIDEDKIFVNLQRVAQN